MPMVLLLVLLATPPKAAPPPRPAPPGASAPAKAPAPWCTGTYADDFSGLSKRAIELNNKPENQFTACVRTTAVYECLSYASDGAVRRTRHNAAAHGSAFAFKKQSGETFLLTNNHVVEWPAVTDEDHPVSGIPVGCKRISDQLRIVDNEKDSFETDDLTLTRVVSDPQLDMAVVKTRGAVNVMPWKLGRSAALRERNVVEVRGYPLGAFKATVEGRVTSSFDHDEFKEWDHDDFVIDAQLSGGNSGSPVLAISCATGEYELVGVYHADYARGHSLNVVVHVDQLREMMTTLKRSTPNRSEQSPLNAQSRKRLSEDAVELGQLFVPFGGLSAEVKPRGDGALLFSVFGREFPTASWPVLVLEDLDDSPEGGFGHPGRVWFGNARGLHELTPFEMEETELISLERSLESMRRLALLVTSFRRNTVRASTSREATQEIDRLEKEIRRVTSQAKDQAQAVLELAEKHAPGPSETPVPPSRPFVQAVETDVPHQATPVDRAP